MSQVNALRYDSEVCMVGRPQASRGYHTQVPDGIWVHPTRETLRWVLAQLDAGADADVDATEVEVEVDQALDALRAVLALQDTDPRRGTYGLWAYLLEEPLDQMAPPDWNWADFLGELLIEIVHRHGDRLSRELKAQCFEALRHAAWSIFRRNVGPGYTNICVLGGAVATLAGELLGEPLLVRYGTARFEATLAAAEGSGSVPEYNSPTYYPVGVNALEAVLRYARDPQAIAAATALHRWYWSRIVEVFHPATGQWAGPHARAYSDALTRGQQRWLAARGVALTDGEDSDRVRASRGIAVACPADVLAQINHDAPTRTVRSALPVMGRPEVPGDRSTTCCLEGPVSLATVSREDTWVQRRPMIGFARTADAELVTLRTRLLQGDRDFASGCVRQSQHGLAALTVLGLTTGRGVWHILLDRPRGALFSIQDLAYLVEFNGPQVEAEQVGEQHFALTAPGVRATVMTGPAYVDGRVCAWHLERGERRVRLVARGVIQRDAPFRLEDLEPTWAVVGAGLATTGGQARDDATEPLDVQHDGETVTAQWGRPLRVQAPTRAASIDV